METTAAAHIAQGEHHAGAQPDSWQDRRNHIVAVAARLFDQQGYHKTGMNDIAAAVGLRKPSLYHYVRSKQEILVLVHEHLIDGLLEKSASPQRRRLPAGEQLREVMADMLALMETFEGYARVFFEHFRELPQQHKESIRMRRDAYFERVLALVEESMDDGDLPRGNPFIATMGLFGMCNWAYQWFRPGGPATSRDVAEQFWQLLTSREPTARVHTSTDTSRNEVEEEA